MCERDIKFFQSSKKGLKEGNERWRNQRNFLEEEMSKLELEKWEQPPWNFTGRNDLALVGWEK